MKADETVVDAYWSQPIDSEICQTIGECRDLGDTYGSEHFTSFLGGLKAIKPYVVFECVHGRR